MLYNNFILNIILILVCTKVLGILAKRMQMPEVVGALIAGIILGPTILGMVKETDFIAKIAQLGVILLMFEAGLETDLKELKKCGKASFIIASLGVVLPLVGGFIVSGFFNNNGNIFNMNNKTFIENIFIGIILTSTSVSITVKTLQEMGKLQTPSGTAILGAAVIDDILGVILLTLVTSVIDPSVNFKVVILKIVIFFILAFILGKQFYRFFEFISNNFKTKEIKDFLVMLAFIFCLVMAFVSETFFNVTDITGAYLAGVAISSSKSVNFVQKKIDALSYLFFSPVFFASIGIQICIKNINSSMLLFTFVLLLVAVFSKIFGCGIGAKLCKYSKDESIQIGTGMISRGEVALIVFNKGVSKKLLKQVYYAPIIIVIVVTTVITPILLKIVYSFNNKKHIKVAV